MNSLSFVVNCDAVLFWYIRLTELFLGRYTVKRLIFSAYLIGPVSKYRIFIPDPALLNVW